MCPDRSQAGSFVGLRKLWHNHSASIILMVVLLMQTLYCLYTGWRIFPYEYWQQQKPPFWLWYSDRYILSILADVFGGLVLIWITKQGREQGSPETGDD